MASSSSARAYPAPTAGSPAAVGVGIETVGIGHQVVEPGVHCRYRQGADADDASTLLAVLAGGGPGNLRRRFGVDGFERGAHGIDGLASQIDLGRVDEVSDGADADDLGGAVAEHLLRAGGEERHGSGRIDAHDGAAGGGPEQRLEAVTGVVGLAGVAPCDARLLGEVAQVGAVARDHRVDGRGDERRHRRHHRNLAPLEGRVLGRTDDEQRHQERQVHTEQADEQVEPPAVEREPHDGEQVHDDEPRVGTTLRVADDGDDGDVADGDDEPRPVGQALPRHEKGGGDQDEEEDAGNGDLAAGVVGERDDGDEDGADSDEREDRQAHPHGAREADRQGSSGHLRFATPGRVGSGVGRLRSPRPRAVAVSEAPHRLEG